MNNFLPTTLALLAATTQVASAQDLGNGSLGSNGVEPLLELVPAATSKPLTFRVSRLNPPGASGAQLLLLIAARPAEIPLDGYGVRGAKLGLDLATLGIVGPFPVPASGVVLLRPTAAKAWNGLELHVQALYVDPRVTPPLTFSDSRSMTIGSATEIVLTRDATQAGTVDLERLLEDGRRGTSVPVLRGLAVRDLDIASLDEARRFRPDLPGLAVADGRRAVRLADGSTLLLYQRGSVNGLARIYRSGRIERVHESPAGTVLPVLAASKTHVAFIDGLRLMLYRTDGSNWSGTTHPLEDVTPTGAANLEMTALVFGRSVLAGMDKRRGLWFVSLSTGKSSFPKLPPSGGRNPFFFDEGQWIPVPPDWSRNIVRGKGYDLTVEPGRALWEAVCERLP
ncbi:MAG: hypothetical protein ACE5EV_06030, partial [Gaiellales bacterium]